MGPDSKITLLLLLGAIAIVGTLNLFTFLPAIEGYDMPPLIDTPSQTARTVEQPVYRFGPVTDKDVTYSDGTVLPSRTFPIERWNSTTQEWEFVIYANTHMHKVKIDHTDELDISIGSTLRINPKAN